MINKIELNNHVFTARHTIGEKVILNVIHTSPIYAYVRAILFTNSKVRYSLYVKEAETTLHNIDSVFVDDVEPGNEETIDFDFDNYS